MPVIRNAPNQLTTSMMPRWDYNAKVRKCGRVEVSRSKMQNVRCESMCESGGLVICKLRTGDLVICELIVRTTDANLGYNGNQKVRTFYAIKRGPYTCLGIRNTEMTFITIQNAERNRLSTCYKNTTKLHVSVTAVVICTILGLYICLINKLTRRKKKLTLKYCLVLHIWK